MFDLPVERRVSKTWRVVAMRMPTLQTLQNTDTEEWNRRNAVDEELKRLNKKKALKEPGKTYVDIHWKEIDGYLYKFFITNDFDKPAEEIVVEYNKRGNAERKFSFLKNDFGWRLPPFMNMNENAVFMIAAALANNIFRAMVLLFKKDVPQLRLNARLREFQFIFINVACAYINDQFVFFEQDILYDKLMI